MAENQLDLFAWAEARAAISLPLAAHVIARRYRMAPHLAAVIATAAGLTGGE
jgi:hypothetical protein